MSKKRIILGVTGSIAAYKAADLVRRLKEKGLRVSVVMTKEAEHFVTPLTLSSLSGEKVHRSLFEEEFSGHMAHIELAHEAGLVVIAPATANIIGKLACGLADDLLTCVCLATQAPLLIVPAMHDEMYKNKAVQGNCRTLKSRGVEFVEPIKGRLACGTMGEGHIAEIETIVKKIEAILKS